MSLPNYKDLKKLAAICRKAGIKSFKNAEMEFTLTEDMPVSEYKAKKASKPKASAPDTTFETDSLPEDALLFWSVGDAKSDGFKSEEEN